MLDKNLINKYGRDIDFRAWAVAEGEAQGDPCKGYYHAPPKKRGLLEILSGQTVGEPMAVHKKQPMTKAENIATTLGLAFIVLILCFTVPMLGFGIVAIALLYKLFK